MYDIRAHMKTFRNTCGLLAPRQEVDFATLKIDGYLKCSCHVRLRNIFYRRKILQSPLSLSFDPFLYRHSNCVIPQPTSSRKMDLMYQSSTSLRKDAESQSGSATIHEQSSSSRGLRFWLVILAACLSTFLSALEFVSFSWSYSLCSGLTAL